MEDEKIIGLLFRRSEAGLDEVRKKYGALMQKIAFDVTHSREDAEEVVNDALLTVWNTVPPELPFSLSAYAAGIARKTALRRCRDEHRQKRSSGLPVEELAEALITDEDAADLSEQVQITRALEVFLSTLDEKSRIIFYRRFWGSESVADLASELGMTRVAVSVRLTRMRAELAQILKQEGVTL